MNLNYPKISVITPSYNQGAFIEETIQSVLNQQYENLEYIIIDGGSSDNTLDIIHKYEQHISFWISEKDNGQSHAINKGFARAAGDILCWLNSDDMFHKGTLNRIGELFIAEPETVFIWGDNCGFDEIIRDTHSKSAYKFKDLFYNLKIVNQESSFWRRCVYDTLGGLDESVHMAMDYEYWLRIFKHYSPSRIKFCKNERFGIVREGHDRKSNDWEAYLESMGSVRARYMPFSNNFLNRLTSSFNYRLLRYHEKKNITLAFQNTGIEKYLGLKGRLL